MSCALAVAIAKTRMMQNPTAACHARRRQFTLVIPNGGLARNSTCAPQRLLQYWRVASPPWDSIPPAVVFGLDCGPSEYLTQDAAVPMPPIRVHSLALSGVISVDITATSVRSGTREAVKRSISSRREARASWGAIGAGVGLCPQFLPPRRNFMHRSERGEASQADLGQTYSITSSARNKVAVGSVIPIAFAVFRLIANSKRSGCSTGRSAGFAPRKIFATNEAPRRITQAKSTP